MTTRKISLGSVSIGGGAPVSVQSMCNTKTEDTEATLRQINELAAAGCDIARLAVPDIGAAKALRDIKSASPLPLVADIHFDHRLAIAALESGADKIRVNPGNIGDRAKVRELAAACKERGVPIRVGVNSGSLEKRLLEKYGGPTPEALVHSALDNIGQLEAEGFYDICVSAKASSVKSTFEANRLLSQRTDCPLHLGVTEAGTERSGLIKSSAGIGGLLLLGIGDTIRFSLTADPVKEVRAGRELLRSLGLRSGGLELISCPGCGRADIDVIALAEEVEARLGKLDRPLTVAVMGCAVNGPGEARLADVGIAGGKGEGLVFAGGRIIKKVPSKRLVEELLLAIESLEEIKGEKAGEASDE